MSRVSIEDLIYDLLVAIFFLALFVVGAIKIQRTRSKNYFSKTYYLFVGSFCSWTLGKAQRHCRFYSTIHMLVICMIRIQSFIFALDDRYLMLVLRIPQLSLFRYVNDIIIDVRQILPDSVMDDHHHNIKLTFAGKAIISIFLMAVPSMNACKAATIFAGVNASAVMEMCKYGTYMGLILIWGDLFLLSFEQTPQTTKRETPKPISNLLIIFVALMVFLFFILFGTNLIYFFAFEDYCESTKAQSTLHILFACSYAFVYLSTVVITIGFWKYLYSLFLDLLAERQSLKQNSAFNKTLLTLAGISVFCLFSFVMKSFFILASLWIKGTYYAAAIVITVLECSCGALLLYGATLEVPMQDNDPQQPLLPSAK